jgi:hypothetical protein
MGPNNTIFHNFSRIFCQVQLSENGWILVEIRNQPTREIIIYDADEKYF